LAEFGSAIEVLFGTLPPVSSQAGDRSVADLARDLLPGPPVVVGIVTLDLVGGGRGAPEEALWEVKGSTVVSQDVTSS